MITPVCAICKNELFEFGGILLSPPDTENKVIKNHLCEDCYNNIITNIITITPEQKSLQYFIAAESTKSTSIKIHKPSIKLLNELKLDTKITVASSGQTCKVIKVDNGCVIVDTPVYSQNQKGILSTLIKGETLLIKL